MTQTECKEVFALLSEYLDREISPDLCDQIEHHIQGCPPCVEFVESLRKSMDLCKRMNSIGQPGPLPEEARAALLAAYRKAVPGA